MADKCSERLFDGSGWGMRNCSRPPTVVRDGKPYCAQHDPERVARLRAEQEAKWAKKAQTEMARRRLEGAAPQLLASLVRICEAAETHAPFLATEIQDARAVIARAQGRSA